MKHIRSEQLFEQSKTCIPGGVNSPVRAYQAVGSSPVFLERAKGSKVYDVDGQEYIDYVCSWGPCILGHCDKNVINAVKQACDKGLTFGAPTEAEYRLAMLIKECMPSMEMTRLVSSGTEAVMSAVRAARGYTGRDKIVKFRGCYHGHSDGLLVKAGSGAMTQSVPDSAGVLEDYTKHTLVAEYNREDSVKELFEAKGKEIAAVIVEPVAANMGVVPPKDGFLQFLREITREYGTLLIFDEVITGFRLALGGAQEYYQVTPDLTTLGKIIGGGMPVGAYGGKKEIMEVVAPAGPVYQAGTLSGNPVSTAAGIATISALKQGGSRLYQELEQKGKRLAESAKEAFKDRVCVNRAGSLLSVFFTKEQVTDFQSADSSDREKYAMYFHYLLEHGIYTAPSQFEAMFLSAVHSDEDIERTIEVIKEAGKVL